MSTDEALRHDAMANWDDGQAVNTPVRVKFGPGKTQEIPVHWAEIILGHMYETQKSGGKPKSFGDLLQLAAMEGK